jgi:hypothetical protein
MRIKRFETQDSGLSTQHLAQRFLLRRWPILSLLLVLIFPGQACSADATTLDGVKGFRIEVGRLSRAVRSLGMDRVRLKIAARERLRRTSIPVGDFPTVLVLSLHTVEHPSSVLAYCLDVEVRQIVHLTRTEQVTLLAPTWAEGKLTMTLRTSFIHSVEAALGVLLDDLARDYRLVNIDVSMDSR